MNNIGNQFGVEYFRDGSISLGRLGGNRAEFPTLASISQGAPINVKLEGGRISLGILMWV